MPVQQVTVPDIGGAEDAEVIELLVVAGDAATSLDNLRTVFLAFKSDFDEVLFIPGNHEAWVSQRANAAAHDGSLEKLGQVLDLAESLGVRTTPLVLKPSRSRDESTNTPKPKPVMIMPLWSWYHASFDKEPNPPMDAPSNFCRRWQDFKQCR